MEDPTADFLAREQAALGEDAALFSGSQGGNFNSINSNPVGGSLDDFEKIEHSPSANFAVAGGGQFQQQQQQQESQQQFGGSQLSPDSAAFQAEFPPADKIETADLASSRASSMSHRQPQEPEPETESEAVQEWRRKYQEAITERDRKSEQKHREQLEVAKQAIDQFYENYNKQKEKAHAKNRENESLQAAENASGTVWEKVAREVDAAAQTQAKATAANKAPPRDRFRQILSDLRKCPTAPGLTA